MDSNSTRSAMNRLAKEKSPYLLQHAHNPVDWYPWGDEAFKKARAENKPVFLSIGYATCHWCHVMEHESFEDEEIADLMNEAFVNIKVDREERPDIDHTYMTVCQMMTGRGGWPLTIVMTPEKEPFFAATYLPRNSRPNIMGMADFIPRIREAWEKDTKRVHEAVERIKAGFTKSLELGTSGGTVSENAVKKAEKSLQNQFDSIHGGFGEAPKFPSPHNLLFLLNRYRTEKDDRILEMAGTTLEKMRLGGLWDHIGRGFHRYSTDSEWLLPHFEKMLYDQAMMLMAYAEGYALTQNKLFKKTALDIVEYTDECLVSPEGAFYSAEDADSEGEEGKFYIWEKQEIENILPDDDARLFCELFGIEDDGNFHDESTRQKTGANIPHLQKPVAEEQSKQVQHILEELHTHRKKRIRPLLDDKILTDWNGLMIAALARSGVILNSPSLIEKAKNAWLVLKKHCLTPKGKLYHRYKDGEAEIEGMADDYAFTIWGLLELYNATFDPDYLSDAISLQKTFYKDFWDTEYSGYFFTSRTGEKLLGRQKEIYDGAIPSSNSVAILNGFRLSRLTGNPEWENQSQNIPGSFSAQINNAPVGFCFALYGFEIMNSNLMEIVICTPEIDSITEKFIQLCRDHAPAHSAILVKTNHQEASLNKHAPFVANYPVKDHPAVYVCRNFECKQPVYTPEDLMAILSE